MWHNRCRVLVLSAVAPFLPNANIIFYFLNNNESRCITTLTGAASRALHLATSRAPTLFKIFIQLYRRTDYARRRKWRRERGWGEREEPRRKMTNTERAVSSIVLLETPCCEHVGLCAWPSRSSAPHFGLCRGVTRILRRIWFF